MGYTLKLFILSISLFFLGCLFLNAQITSFPYFEDFESGTAGWTVQGSNTSWELGFPYIGLVSGPASGSNAWATNLDGFYSPNENGWVQSPVFDLSTLITPYVQLSINWDSWSDDVAILQSSVDLGISWQTVGTIDDAINWYNNPNGWSGLNTYNSSSGGWITAIHSLNQLIGENEVIFRIMFTSDGGSQEDGFGFDLFSVSDSPCYAGEDNFDTVCSSTGLIDLNNYLINNIGNGFWESFDLNILEDGIVDITGTESGDYSFYYIIDNGVCYDQAIVTLTIEKALSPGENGTFECSVLTSESELFSALGGNPDLGGSWSYPLEGFGAAGIYIYTHYATSNCPEAFAEVEFINGLPDAGPGGEIFIYDPFYDALSVNLNSLLNEYLGITLKNSSSSKVMGKKKKWTLKKDGTRTKQPVNLETDTGDVDFPNTGSGPEQEYIFEYSVENDCGEIATAEYTFWIGGAESTNEQGSISICGSQTLTKSNLFSALTTNGLRHLDNPWFDEFDNQVTFPVGAGVYNYEDDTFNTATVTVTKELALLNLSVLLQGPYDTGTGLMKDDLRSKSLLETTSPYADGLTVNSSVFNLGGSSGIGQVQDDIVDWVWIELRDSYDISSVLYEQSALLQRDGDIVGLDGLSPLSIDVNYFNAHLVVSHRNHLGVMSGFSVVLECGFINSFDLKSNSSYVNGGTNAIKDMGDGKFALFAGDFNGDGQIQNTDKNAVEPLRGISGYSDADIDMNGEVQNTDLNSVLNPNLGKGKQYTGKQLYAKRKKP